MIANNVCFQAVATVTSMADMRRKAVIHDSVCESLLRVDAVEKLDWRILFGLFGGIAVAVCRHMHLWPLARICGFASIMLVPWALSVAPGVAGFA